MAAHCRFVIDLLLLLVAAASVRASTVFQPIKTHTNNNGISLPEQVVATDNKNEEIKSEDKPKPAEPLNLIFNPTAQQVSDENKKLLDVMESGLHSLRTAFDCLTHLIHLLPESEKQNSITVDKKSYTIAELLDSLSNYIADGEKQQRVLIEGTAEILHKLATPNSTSQNAQ
ncbi:uncharacterized protein BXIN_3085 [Babesia sp. Xinjiang]|uniref:uncharacterized protein n=1 Tax=Babesia sp. Xinjiang TaxID=462227 RepID=UPI000A253285|nr:uncharacterized protein BXIN_3085 [Babesia sp. Xinjiang]ORM39556.1 hypothetical protein BXIN_3085 [Babesia sp. Xinjiang]